MQQQNDYDDIILLSILAIVDDDSQSTFLTLFLTQTSRRLRLRKGSIDQATNRQEQKRTRERKHYAFIFLPHAHHRPSYSSLTYFFFFESFLSSRRCHHRRRNKSPPTKAFRAGCIMLAPVLYFSLFLFLVGFF